MISDEAISVACEHCRWCKSIGMSPAQIIATFAPPWLTVDQPSWDDAVWAIGRAFQELPRDGPVQLAA
jgi:hypothetical protein